MSEFLKENNFYQIRHLLYSIEKVEFSFNKNIIKEHKVKIKNLNYFSDILDKLGSDAYVVFPFYSLKYKWALYHEFYNTMQYNYGVLINNDEFISYKDKKAPIIYTKLPIMPYRAVDNEGLNGFWKYDNSPHITYGECYGGVHCIFSSMQQPYVWITNGRDLTYAFNSNFKE